MNRSYALFILMLLIGTDVLVAQDREKELVWSGSATLLSSDFKMRRTAQTKKIKTGKNSYSTLEGFIYCGINFSYESNGRQVRYEVYAYMDPSQSWLRDSSSVETLEHEQAHFNIAEIYARKLKSDLRSERNLKKARKKYADSFKDLQEKQRDFDKDHMSEVGVEKKWILWINQNLEKLNEYSSKEIRISQ